MMMMDRTIVFCWMNMIQNCGMLLGLGLVLEMKLMIEMMVMLVAGLNLFEILMYNVC
jgi:hypothetical protein